jgi:hypothetical protein
VIFPNRFGKVINKSSTGMFGVNHIDLCLEIVKGECIVILDCIFSLFVFNFRTNLRSISCKFITQVSFLPEQVFDTDGIHLTEASGEQFVESILYYAGKIFDAQLVDEEQMEVQVESGSSNIVPLTDASREQKTTEEKLKDVLADLEKRRVNDDMMFARLREELDFIANTKKEDRVMVTGMTTLAPKPTGQVEARTWIREVAGAALEAIVPGAGAMIQFVSPNRSLGSEVPACEVKIKDREFALKMRKEYGRLRKEGKLEGRVFVANCVTLGTRVRMEVLKAIGKKCSGPGEDLFVHGFTSRPVLQVKPKNGGPQFALTYVDAIKRYGNRVKEADLGLAYERAGMSFVGQMRQNFIVLTDKGVRQGGRQTRGGSGGGPRFLSGANKRPLEEGNDKDGLAKRQSGSDQRGGRGGGAGRGGAGRGETPKVNK